MFDWSIFLRKSRDCGAVLFFAALLFPAVSTFGNLFFVDLRLQELMPGENLSRSGLVLALGIALLYPALVYKLMRRSGRSLKEFFIANLPLVPLGVMWFGKCSFPLLILSIFLWAWSAGRSFGLCTFLQVKELSREKTALVLSAAVLLFALLGTYQQIASFNTLSMAWFDWGHFYESLINCLQGRPFHLNLCHGSFLGSRFTPSLLLLLPAAATGSVFLFFFVSSLLVGSGAFFVFLISRTLKAGNNESLLMGLWYLLIPGVANMNLPLIDGFHEVFMLFPLVLGSVWCYLEKKYIAAVICFLLALGVRETAGIIFAGYGLILFFSGKRKAGVFVTCLSLVYVVLALKVFMPLFNPPKEGTYAHVGYFSHLGSSVWEIALSPVMKPEVFWSSCFNGRNLLFWCTLLLPFLPLAPAAWVWLLPCLPDLVMISVDRRYDTQTVLRHYQISVLLVLILGALLGAQQLRKGKTPAWLKALFAGLNKVEFRRGALAMLVTGTCLCGYMFIHLPGLPASEPQRRNTAPGWITPWEDARPMMERVRRLIPRGAKVTAGPRLASMLVGDYDIYFDFTEGEEKLQEYVLLENFFSFYYPEAAVSRMLLTSPNWELLHQEFTDERSVQLFRRSAKALAKKRPLFKVEERVWQKLGYLIALPVKDLEVRAIPLTAEKIRFAVRLLRQRQNDAGFRITMTFASGKNMKFFTSFGNGRFPADLALPGECFLFEVNCPAGEKLQNCKVEVVELTGKETPK